MIKKLLLLTTLIIATFSLSSSEIRLRGMGAVVPKDTLTDYYDPIGTIAVTDIWGDSFLVNPALASFAENRMISTSIGVNPQLLYGTSLPLINAGDVTINFKNSLLLPFKEKHTLGFRLDYRFRHWGYYRIYAPSSYLTERYETTNDNSHKLHASILYGFKVNDSFSMGFSSDVDATLYRDYTPESFSLNVDNKIGFVINKGILASLVIPINFDNSIYRYDSYTFSGTYSDFLIKTGLMSLLKIPAHKSLTIHIINDLLIGYQLSQNSFTETFDYYGSMTSYYIGDPRHEATILIKTGLSNNHKILERAVIFYGLTFEFDLNFDNQLDSIYTRFIYNLEFFSGTEVTFNKFFALQHGLRTRLFNYNKLTNLDYITEESDYDSDYDPVYDLYFAPIVSLGMTVSPVPLLKLEAAAEFFLPDLAKPEILLDIDSFTFNIELGCTFTL